MADSWHVAKGKTKLGPFSLEQLQELARTGELLPSDMVLPAGSGKWTSASGVNGVFGAMDLLPTAPPAKGTEGAEAAAIMPAPQRRARPAAKPVVNRPLPNSAPKSAPSRAPKRSRGKILLVGCAALAAVGCLVVTSASVVGYYWITAALEPHVQKVAALPGAAGDLNIPPVFPDEPNFKQPDGAPESNPKPPPDIAPESKPEPPPVSKPEPKPESPPVVTPKGDEPGVKPGGTADPSDSKSAEKLDGKWFVVRQEEHGGPVPAVIAKRLSMVIDGGKMEWYIGNPGANFAATITLDEEKKTVDAKITRSSFIGKTMLGIYKFENGQLHMCWGEIGTDKRPEKYASTKPGGGAFNYTVYSRKPVEASEDVAKKGPPEPKRPPEPKQPPAGARPKLSDLKFTLPKGWEMKYRDGSNEWTVAFGGFAPSITVGWALPRDYPTNVDDYVGKLQKNGDHFGYGVYWTTVVEKGNLPDGLYVIGKMKVGKAGKEEAKRIAFSIIRDFGGEKMFFESFSDYDARQLREALEICKSAKFPR
jgi:uncharacterized protein (TIGR03067 family)